MPTRSDKSVSCGCCGDAIEWSPDRRPGRTAIDYRLGTQTTFFDSMVSAVQNQSSLAGRLTTRAKDDPTIALLDAWACTLDVLSFYQERIANEGYLRTATERRSIVELSRSIGYELGAGVAAQTALVFELETAPGAPALVQLAEGMQVQSVPQQDERPQTFETIDAIEARPQWNALRPKSTRAQLVGDGARKILFGEDFAGVRPGDSIVFIRRTSDVPNSSDHFQLVKISQIEPGPRQSTTVITLTESLSGFDNQSPAQNPHVFLLRDRAEIFGYNASNWRLLPLTSKEDYLSRKLEPGEELEWPEYTILSPNSNRLERVLIDGDEIKLATKESMATVLSQASSAASADRVANAAAQGMQAVASASEIASTAIRLAETTATGLGTLVENSAAAVQTAANHLIGVQLSMLSGIGIPTQAAIFNTVASAAQRVRDVNDEVTAIVGDLPPAADDIVQEVVTAAIAAINAGELADPVARATLEYVEQKTTGLDVATLTTNLTSGLAVDADGLVIPTVDANDPQSVVDGTSEYVASMVGGMGDEILAVLGNDPPGTIAALEQSVTDALDEAATTVTASYAALSPADLLANFGAMLSGPIGDFTGEISDAVDGVTSAVGRVSAATLESTREAMNNVLGDTVGVAAQTALDARNAVLELGSGAGELAQSTERTVGGITGAIAAAVTAAAVDMATNIALGSMDATPESVGTAGKEAARLSVEFAPHVVRGGALAGAGLVGGVAGGAGAAALAPALLIATAATSGVGLAVTAGGALALAGAAPAIAAPLALGPGQVLTENQADAAVSGARQVAYMVADAYETELARVDHNDRFENRFPTRISDTIDLDRIYRNLEEDSWIVLARPGKQRLFQVRKSSDAAREEYGLSAKTTRLKLNDSAGLKAIEPNAKTAPKVRETTAFIKSRPVQLVEQADLRPVEGRVVQLDRVVPELNAGRQIVFVGAGENGERLTEIAILKTQTNVGDHSVFELEESLRHKYVRSSLFVHANVASATHGETKVEAVGSGDRGRAYQSFKLKQQPLTHVPASTSRGSQSTLNITVNDLSWDEVETLYTQDERARVYTTQSADDGEITLHFGDGHRGSRLPTGNENIRASYRVGIGLEGMVKSDQLTQLMTRPLGVNSVTNPISAEGAEDPESIANTRKNAPITVTALERIVSLVDYEDFARNFGGVGKASAVLIWTGQANIVHVSLSDARNEPVDPLGQLVRNLKIAMNNARDPSVPLYVDTYDEIAFQLKANVRVGREFNSELVITKLRSTLAERFGAAKRVFAQPVTSAEILAAAHSVDGIEYIDIDKFQKSGSPDTTSIVAARPARWNDAVQAVQRAELLTIDTSAVELREIS